MSSSSSDLSESSSSYYESSDGEDIPRFNLITYTGNELCETEMALLNALPPGFRGFDKKSLYLSIILALVYIQSPEEKSPSDLCDFWEDIRIALGEKVKRPLHFFNLLAPTVSNVNMIKAIVGPGVVSFRGKQLIKFSEYSHGLSLSVEDFKAIKVEEWRLLTGEDMRSYDNVLDYFEEICNRLDNFINKTRPSIAQYKHNIIYYGSLGLIKNMKPDTNYRQLRHNYDKCRLLSLIEEQQYISFNRICRPHSSYSCLKRSLDISILKNAAQSSDVKFSSLPCLDTDDDIDIKLEICSPTRHHINYDCSYCLSDSSNSYQRNNKLKRIKRKKDVISQEEARLQQTISNSTSSDEVESIESAWKTAENEYIFESRRSKRHSNFV